MISAELHSEAIKLLRQYTALQEAGKSAELVESVYSSEFNAKCFLLFQQTYRPHTDKSKFFEVAGDIARYNVKYSTDATKLISEYRLFHIVSGYSEMVQLLADELSGIVTDNPAYFAFRISKQIALSPPWRNHNTLMDATHAVEMQMHDRNVIINYMAPLVLSTNHNLVIGDESTIFDIAFQVCFLDVLDAMPKR